MVFSENVNLVLILSRLAYTLDCAPIKFDRRTKRAHLLNKSKSLNFRLFTLLVLLTAAQCLFKKADLVIKSVIAWCGLTLLIMTQVQGYICQIKSQEMVQYINDAFLLESNYFDASTKLPDPFSVKLNLVFVKLALITAMVFPACFSFILHWKQPCKASLTGYFFIIQCHTKFSEKAGNLPEALYLLTKVLVMVFNQWMWTFAVYASTFCVSIFQVMAIIS